MDAQFKKGILKLCVLALLERRDWYGYEISDYLVRKIAVADGTVYPLLRKLKADGLVATYLQEESGGPPRKYYSLTGLGRESLNAEREAYLAFSRVVNDLLEGKDDDKE